MWTFCVKRVSIADISPVKSKPTMSIPLKNIKRATTPTTIFGLDFLTHCKAKRSQGTRRMLTTPKERYSHQPRQHLHRNQRQERASRPKQARARIRNNNREHFRFHIRPANRSLSDLERLHFLHSSPMTDRENHPGHPERTTKEARWQSRQQEESIRPRHQSRKLVGPSSSRSRTLPQREQLL